MVKLVGFSFLFILILVLQAGCTESTDKKHNDPAAVVQQTATDDWHKIDLEKASSVISFTQVEDSVVVLTVDGSTLKATINIADFQIDGSKSDCEKLRISVGSLQYHYAEWLKTKTYSKDSNLEIEIIEILSYDEYNQAKDAKFHGIFIIEGIQNTVSEFLSKNTGSCFTN